MSSMTLVSAVLYPDMKSNWISFDPSNSLDNSQLLSESDALISVPLYLPYSKATPFPNSS